MDTEFIEDGTTIDLLSIGIESENGETYYAISTDCDLSKASEWVKENVVKNLPQRFVNFEDWSTSPRLKEESRQWKPRTQIRKEVAEFLGAVESQEPVEPKGFERWLKAYYSQAPEWVAIFLAPLWILFPEKTKFVYTLAPLAEKPEIWAYYADYDWVAFCQLFGTMMDIPKGFPMYCRDIKQECDRLGNPKLPEQEIGEHNALEDAKWNRKAWGFLQEYRASQLD